MKCAYRIYSEEGIVVYRVTGRATLQGFNELFSKIGSDPFFHSELKGLADLRNIEYEVKIAGVKHLAVSVLNEPGQNCSWVTLVSEPTITALSMLFSRIVSSKYRVDICSTEIKASELLLTDVRPYLSAISKLLSQEEDLII